ncbi:MAG: excinuclease ABC subunit C, partial [Deltaproteobacteria bacterium]|nr:excinuclease ABC subunit C [Deltaproteobacteria bacterium]
ECYDISHFQGSETFGSMVTFIQGQPYKSYYRRFKLESLKGPDDFASLYEVLCRRLRRAKEEADLESPWALPQLMVIDGGKGQLKAALAALKDENVTGIALVALAKSRSQSAGTPGALPTRSEERFFLPARKNPVTFRVQSGALKLLTHLRDEAHRFGISAQRGAQRKKSLASALEEVPGLGIKRRTKLLQTYGSYEKIKQARPEDLASLLKVSLKQSEEILSRLS